MNGKTALVTGASRGMGRALAEELGKRGWKVYGGARSWGADDGAGFTRLKLDVTNWTEVNDAVERVIKDHGRLDLVVNNAGISHSGSVEDTPLTVAERVFETDYFGVVNVIKAALPLMRERGGGTIAVVGSAAGKIAVPFQAHYAASKFAIEGLCESLWHEVRRFNVKVKLIEPGDVGTTIWQDSEHLAPVDSPYAKMMESYHAKKAVEMGGKADRPVNVAREMADACEDESPRLRFPVAKGASFVLLARKLLPDRVFLMMVGRNYGIR